MAFAEGLDAGSVASAASYLNRPAEEYINDSTVEQMWVFRTMEFANIHYNLISSAPPRNLKLTKSDDDRIYHAFAFQFPGFNIKVVTEESLKSEKAKENWRVFCDKMKDIDDYSFGTLLRLDCRGEYTEENTILVTRVQFLAIEIARNRCGLNDDVYFKNEVVPGIVPNPQPDPSMNEIVEQLGKTGC